MSRIPYALTVGSLMYPSRPCICRKSHHPIHVLSRKAINYIFRYLRGTENIQPIEVEYFTDFDCVGNPRQSEIDIKLCLHIRRQSYLMGVETTGMHDTLHDRGWVHSRVGGNQRGNLAATTDDQIFNQEQNRLSSADLVLRLTERKPPDTEPNIPCQSKT